MKAQALPNAAILLSAGGSRRMGRSKALLRLGSATVLEAHVAALRGYSRRVVVVLGHDAPRHSALLPPDVQVVHNARWAESWPADSLRLALQEAQVEGRCWVTPVDTPPAAPETLEALLEAGAPAVPVDARGRGGHPVLLDARLVERIRRGAPDGGLRTLLGHATRVLVQDPLVSRDFDTPEAWRAFVEEYTRSTSEGT